MPEGFLRSLHRRSVRARQALFVRRHKPTVESVDNTNESRTPRQSVDKTSETIAVTCTCAVSTPAQPQVPTSAHAPPDIITSTSCVNNEEVEIRTPQHSKELRFQLGDSRPQTIGSEREIPKSSARRCMLFSTPISARTQDAETPKKATATPRAELAASFLRRSMRRRSVLHFHTPRAELPANLPGEARHGLLLKISNSTLSRGKMTRKFVALHEDGTLRYFPTAQDYMAGTRAKEIPLQCAAVRVPRTPAKICSRSASLATSGYATPCRGSWYAKDEVELTGFQERRSGGSPRRSTQDLRSIGDEGTPLPGGEARQFEVVSSEGRAWRFEAASVESRDEWVRALERAILRSLQHSMQRSGEENAALALRCVPGNNKCADCGAPDPTWASVSLGVLVCIECSGAHRSLQISRVRSLELDHWTRGQLAALRLLGNAVANSVWESELRGHVKPTPISSVQEKRDWVQNKYAARYFLPTRAPLTALELQTAVRTRDMRILLAADTLTAHALLLLAGEAQDEALTQLMAWQCNKQPGCTVKQSVQREPNCAVNTELSSLVDLIESCAKLI